MSALAFSRSLFTVIAVFLVLNCFQYQTEALVLKEEFSQKTVTQLKVNLPADEVWNVYKSKDFAKLLPKLNPASVKQVDYVTGDGGVGTLVNLTAQPEVGGGYYLDQIIEIDDTTMTRIVLHVRGVYRDAGLTLVQTDSRVLKKEKTSCIIETTVFFKIRPESLSNGSLIRVTFLPDNLIVDYIHSMKSTPLVLHKEFKGQIVTEMKVNLPADAVWDVYKSKEFGHLLQKFSPGYFKQIDYIKGDGGVGTILNITVQPAFGGANWLDELIALDDRTKTRVLRIIRGGLLNIGFTGFSSRYRIIKKAHKSCVIRSYPPFKIAADSYSMAAILNPGWVTAMNMSDYVNNSLKF